MKRIFLTFLLFSALALNAQEVERFVHEQLEKYPEARLQDLYKSCFQDYMGAEHIVTDMESVRSYIGKELEQVDTGSTCSCYYEPCGIGGRYVRVDLRAVRDGLITEPVLADAFFRSASSGHSSVRKWRRMWKKIVGKIDRMNLNLPDYVQDKNRIDSLLAEGKYATSHSRIYRETYSPHYRIVKKEIFEEEIKYLLDVIPQ